MNDRLLYDFSAALGRILSATGCTTQVELADFLGVRQAFISDAARRGEIPAEWLIRRLRLRGINPEWILSGQGRMLLQPVYCVETVTPPAVYAGETAVLRSGSFPEAEQPDK